MYDTTSQFELQVCPNGRSKADEYYHQGTIWIEGREGSNYTLRFINKSSGKVGVVFSVDGLDTIKGNPAGVNSDNYIVNAYDSLEVPGWVLHDQSAAQFYFTKAGRDYVSASGNNTSNTGVIGAMVFREKVNYDWYPQTQVYSHYPFNNVPFYGQPFNGTLNANPDFTKSMMRSAPTVAMATAASAHDISQMTQIMASSFVEQDVGTGFGNEVDFNTNKVSFIRANPTVPDAILAVYYNTAKNLQKMGINIKTVHTKYDNSSAQPFPTYQPGCKPPPGWTT